MKPLLEILKNAKSLPFKSFGSFLITPEVAADLLEFDTEFNRNVSIGSKKALMQALIDKEFQFNGDAIRFSVEKDRAFLVDGKTRLLACRDSGISFEALVIWDLLPESVPTIDIGRRRQLYQIIHMMGKQGNTSIASAAGLLYGWQHSLPVRIPSTNTFVQPYQLQEAFEAYPFLIEDITYASAKRLHRKFAIIRPSIGMAAFALLAQSDLERTKNIFDALLTGESISHKLLFRLRERLIDENGRKATVSKDEMVKRFIFVSNIIAENKDLAKFPSPETILKVNSVK